MATRKTPRTAAKKARGSTAAPASPDDGAPEAPPVPPAPGRITSDGVIEVMRAAVDQLHTRGKIGVKLEFDLTADAGSETAKRLQDFLDAEGVRLRLIAVLKTVGP